ncbi:DUF7096 domain-containing protein [Natronomonas sp. EA1]|uniref:DUF7096 domain-containing protein n=1 Tax=Natronomonas sp. EA1 TaxID=3421655 RepID=UPI003EBFA8B6
MDAAPVAFALLVVLSATAVAAPGSSSSVDALSTPVQQEANTTSYLSLGADDIRTTRFDVVTLDVGGSLAVDNARLRGQYEATRLQQAYRAAESSDARRAVVREAADRIDDRIDALHSRQREALVAYNSDQLSARGYLRELAAVNAEAKALETAIARLYSLSRAVGEPVEQSRIARMKARLLPFDGPVRSAIAAGFTGESSVRVYIETSSDGVTLTTLSRGEFGTTYVRETYDGGAFAPDDEPRVTFDEAREELFGLYPWAIEQGVYNIGLFTNAPYYLDAGVYAFGVNHPQGTDQRFDLVAYYDNRTGEVFREVQYKDVERVPTTTVANVSEDGFRVRVRATHPGGPAQVTVTNASTGLPRDAVIYVGDQRVGTVDENGDRWIIAPRGTTTVSATWAGRSANVTVDSTTFPA